MLQNGGEAIEPKSVYVPHPNERQTVANEHRCLPRGRFGKKRREGRHHGRLLSAYNSRHHNQ